MPEGDVVAGARDGAVIGVGRRGLIVAQAASRPQNQQAHGKQGIGDQIEPPKEVLNLGLRRSGKGQVRDQLLQWIADDRGEQRGPDGADGEALEGVRGGEVGALPLVPEVDDHREHGSGVQHDQDQGHLRRGGIEPEQLLRDDHVRGAGDRQKLRETLNDRQNQNFEQRHKLDSNCALKTGCESAERPCRCQAPPRVFHRISEIRGLAGDPGVKILIPKILEAKY